MGLRLGASRATVWRELGSGVRVHMRPATSVEIEASVAAARERVRSAIEGADALRDLGMDTPDAERLSDRFYSLGICRWIAATELGVQLVDDWEGVEAADGSAAELTPANLADLFLFESMMEGFERHAYARHAEITREGEGSPPPRHGSAGAAGNTAQDAARTAPHAPGATARAPSTRTGP